MVPPLAPAPFPASNPLVGLVPYAGEWTHAVPHSMEFEYFSIGPLSPAPGKWNWTPVDELLITIARRKHQAILRFVLEYPGKTDGLPAHLVADGLKVTDWTNDDGRNLTPDYNDPRLRAFVRDFVTALGKRYDGDPRLAYLTMGVLGKWGEWHDWPRDELFASKAVQAETMDHFRRAFRKTPVLLRYPRAQNRDLPFGYHDDSFAWATLESKDPNESWFFLTAMRAAGAMDKWKRHPIGGEIRPELWGITFDPKPVRPEQQDFDRCVRETRVSWLMDSGMFSRDKPLDPARRERAIASVSRMGYVPRMLSATVGKGSLTLRATNLGVAPFYADWPARLAWLDARGRTLRTWPATFRLKGLMPGAVGTFREKLPEVPRGAVLALEIPNPMPGGPSVRFANAGQDRHRPGWLTLLTRRAAL